MIRRDKGAGGRRAEKEKAMPAGCHVHTGSRDDSEYPVEEVGKDAVVLGLNEL